ncbi:MAG: DUF1963 domain-containing protein, partial [Ruminococcus sp.]|nr:DUF1963 domain-containing protein [Ruminococcus sp.]
INDVKSCVKITLTDTKPSIFESKVGGLGYISHNSNFPTDSKGRQLRLLAQIDCAEIQLDEFPENGLLQFWIMNDEDYKYGCDFDNPTNQDGFRVIYYPETDTTVTEEEIRNKFVKSKNDDDKYRFPVLRECGMRLERHKEQYIDYDNYYSCVDPEGDMSKEYGFEIAWHKIGGYPYFIIVDPKDDEHMKDYDFLLFQLNTDAKNNEYSVWWGTYEGVGSFFINSEKLRKLDFSDVLYTHEWG